jgi:hypothetical protein
MCQMCDTHLTYGQLYNIVYNDGEQRDACLRELLSLCKGGCLRLQKRMVRNLHKMIDTQSILQNVESGIITSVGRERMVVHKIVAMRTRRLSRSMLRHAYRPTGRMFVRTMEAMFPPKI